MAKVNNYQTFSQVDYCISQYYSKYMASTLVQEKKRIEKNQTKEFMDAIDKEDNRSIWAQAVDSRHGVTPAYRAKKQVDANGKWNKMSTDNLIERCNLRWNKDKRLQNDYSTFVYAFYENLVVQNGGKESKKLFEYAQSYVMHRFEMLMVEQLAREKVPRNTASYIARKTFSDSLIAFVMPTWGLKKGEYGEKVENKAEAIYDPSALSKATGFLGASLIDTAMMGGFGGVASGSTKAIAKAGIGVGSDFGIREFIGHKSSKDWSKEEYAKENSKEVFGDADALQKIQTGSAKYRKSGTEFIDNINSVLSRKIKVAPLSVSDSAKKASNALLVQHKGNSAKLLNTIKTDFSKQCIAYKGNTEIPRWMLAKTAKQNRAFAATFHSLAIEMSKQEKDWIKCGGKKMSLKEVSQRAYDYARSADYLDKHTPHQSRKAASAKGKDQWDVEMEKLNASINGTVPEKKHRHSSSPTPTRSSASSTRLPYAQQSTPASSQTIQTQQAESTQQTSQTGNNSQQFAGWGNILKQMGLHDFSTVSKNLGYVLAMLPDMLIGMFTGKNPNMKMQDNLMPLAAIVGGMFIKNPLIKMLLIGFGGVNILNNAGHASLKEGLSRSSSASKMYKKYEDEKLNPRITDVTMKGGSMIATIDGSPCVINISNSAADAYQKGVIPLNTLANAVLKKYDENLSLASHKYEQINRQENSVPQQIGIK